jgi:hypothetical protein
MVELEIGEQNEGSDMQGGATHKGKEPKNRKR